ncbi:hypothetical protein AgCh_028201 [Apium graveolens]
MENIKKSWVRCYDIFKGGLSGFGWDPIKQHWIAEPEVWKQLIEIPEFIYNVRLPEDEEWMKKSFKHYHEMVEMFGIDQTTGKSFITTTEIRRQNLATGIDDSASTDNVPVSSTMSQSQYQIKIENAKTDDEQTLKLADSIGILAGTFKEMVDNKKCSVTVEQVWDIINDMELVNEDLVAVAFVFLVKIYVQVKGLISTTKGMRKLVLDPRVLGLFLSRRKESNFVKNDERCCSFNSVNI